MIINLEPTIAKPAQKDLTAAIQLGVYHHQAGNIEQAESIYQQIIQVHPNNANALHLLGLIAHQRGEHHCAVDHIKQAIHINGSISDFHYNLGNVFKAQNELQDAADCFQAAIRLNPAHMDALNNLGNVLRKQGKIEDALEAFKSLLEMKPDCKASHSNFLLTLNYRSILTPTQIFEEHKRWSEKQLDPFKDNFKPFTNDKNPNRHLRIGYISPDFRRHSVAFFIEAVLEAHDRSKFEIICYSNTPRPDAVTERIQKLSDRWHNIWQITDDQVVDLIRSEKIDILIDLAGHMGNNRLPIFTLKPVPIQVTYLGYPNTTGLSTMDYRLTDAWADPCGETDHLYSEKLVRLPNGFLCFRPPEYGPVIADLPAFKKGMVTFGCFNNIAKVSRETAELWSEILKSIPNSRLLLKFRALMDKTTCQRIRQMFSQQGVSADRIETIGYIPSYEDHLALYNEIDIALDPFPYNGTTTTCEALWMGTPVVTLAGNSHASRVGVSLLSSIEMTDLIAETFEQYKHIAVRLSKDLNQLQTLRTGLRHRILQSPLTDAKEFTRSLEDVYREMWKTYCSRFDATGSVSRPENNNRTIPLASTNKTCREDENSQSSPGSRSAVSMDTGFKALINPVYQKRMNGEGLSAGDLMLMLANTILDQRFFQSEHWNWRYGGVRYHPRDSVSTNPKKILVLQWPSALGDAAMAAHFYTALRHKYPHSHIALLGSNVTRSLYEHSGFIDTFFDNPLATYLDQVASGQAIPIRDLMEQITVLVKQFASEAFDLVVNLQILPMTAIIAKLSGEKETLGMTLSQDGMPIILGNAWYPYLFGTSANLMRSYNGMHRRFILNRLAGFNQHIYLDPAMFIGPKSIQTVQQFFDDNGIKDHEMLIGISPLASSPLKTWKQYDGLVKALWEKYDAKTILFGSDSEKDAISRIIEKFGVPAIPGIQFNPNELMAAISGCDLFITNDTGPMHLASLMNKKIIALFGPTITREVGPWSEDYIVLQSKICKECFQTTCSSQNTCMDHISIQDVIRAVDFFLNNNQEANEKASTCVTWQSPANEKQFSSSLDLAISNKFLRLLESQESHSTDPGIHQKETGPILEFCDVFKGKVINALGQLDRGCNPERLADIDKEITAGCGFLRTILIFNDMKYLDKRRTIETDPTAYRLYYLGILKDIDHFLAL